MATQKEGSRVSSNSGRGGGRVRCASTYTKEESFKLFQLPAEAVSTSAMVPMMLWAWWTLLWFSRVSCCSLVTAHKLCIWVGVDTRGGRLGEELAISERASNFQRGVRLVFVTTQIIVNILTPYTPSEALKFCSAAPPATTCSSFVILLILDPASFPPYSAAEYLHALALPSFRRALYIP